MSTGPILVWGAGAIGGTIGAYLRRAGQEVVFVDIDGDHVAAINEQGLAVEGPIDNFSVTGRAFTPATLTGRFDRILLCVKAHHTTAAVAAAGGASGAGRLCRVFAERAERVHHRGRDRTRADDWRLRQFRCRLF
ncbi:MAG: 2-dehydropantoate 2-reductase N-terminal domain-containing protein [Aliidongia sp.]